MFGSTLQRRNESPIYVFHLLVVRVYFISFQTTPLFKRKFFANIAPSLTTEGGLFTFNTKLPVIKTDKQFFRKLSLIGSCEGQTEMTNNAISVEVKLVIDYLENCECGESGLVYTIDIVDVHKIKYFILNKTWSIRSDMI